MPEAAGRSRASHRAGPPLSGPFWPRACRQELSKGSSEETGPPALLTVSYFAAHRPPPTAHLTLPFRRARRWLCHLGTSGWEQKHFSEIRSLPGPVGHLGFDPAHGVPHGHDLGEAVVGDTCDLEAPGSDSWEARSHQRDGGGRWEALRPGSWVFLGESQVSERLSRPTGSLCPARLGTPDFTSSWCSL